MPLCQLTCNPAPYKTLQLPPNQIKVRRGGRGGRILFEQCALWTVALLNTLAVLLTKPSKAYNSNVRSSHSDIPHICHFLYTGRIFKFHSLHLKITQIYPKKSKICSFFAFNLEKFTPDRIFYTGSARGARDKYEVCSISML